MRRLAPALLAASLFVAACSDQGNQAPTPSEPSATPEATLVNPPGCPTDAQMAVQIHALFPRPLEAVAAIKYAAIRAAMIANKTTLARQLMYATVDWTLKQYNAGALIGGMTPPTQAKVTAFINALYCIVGLPLPTIPPGSLGPDGAVAIVSPSTAATPVVTGNGLTGVQIPGGGVSVPTLITVSKIPGGLLPTQLDQYGVYEFTASPALPEVNDAVVGFCIEDILPSTLQVAHQVSNTEIVILPTVSPDFLGCSSFSSRLGPNPTLQEYARWGLARAGQALLTVLAPVPLNASIVGQTGVGGKTKSLSPFGVVDPRINVTAASLTSITGIAGLPVPSTALPSVKLATPLGNPVSGYPVTFSVAAGSQGTLPSGGSATTSTSGVATLSAWTLGADLVPNQVNATVAPSQAEIVINGSPVLFTANAISPTLVSYQSGGYRYDLIGKASAPAGWETGAEGDGWFDGTAAFGTGLGGNPPSPTDCHLDGTVHTTWPAAASPSDISDLLVHRTVTLPNGFVGTLRISVAIDNDIQVFVDGNNITSTGGTPDDHGFLRHEGCATPTPANFVFTALQGDLLPGVSHLVAVRARDRGVDSYFDMEVKLVPAAP